MPGADPRGFQGIEVVNVPLQINISQHDLKATTNYLNLKPSPC